MANRCYILAFLQKKLGPEGTTDLSSEEARQLVCHTFKEELEVSGFLLGLVGGYARII